MYVDDIGICYCALMEYLCNSTPVNDHCITPVHIYTWIFYSMITEEYVTTEGKICSIGTSH